MQNNTMRSDMFFVCREIAHEITISHMVHLGFTIMKENHKSITFHNGHILEQMTEVRN